jgi:hypothetical protein
MWPEIALKLVCVRWRPLVTALASHVDCQMRHKERVLDVTGVPSRCKPVNKLGILSPPYFQTVFVIYGRPIKAYMHEKIIDKQAEYERSQLMAPVDAR